MVTQLHRTLERAFLSRNPAVTLSVCVVMVLVIGWIDYLTGDYSLIVFYLIPVSLAAWFVGRISGLLFCLLTAIVRLSVDESGVLSPSGSHSMLHYWNELVEFLFLMIMSLLFSVVKRNLDTETEFAQRDPLTSALNRRSFFVMAEHEINRAQRYGLPMTVAYIDLDNFKSVNDQLGHHVGDELLISVVSEVRTNIRSSDVLARFGGDEFVILLPDTSSDAALALLNKIHRHLDLVMARSGWPVSFSIGAATFIHVPSTVDEVIRHADELMYQVKHGSRNGLLHRVIGEGEHG